VSAARRSALAAAAFSACEVLMAELRREWQAAMADGASVGGGGALDSFNSTVNACVGCGAEDLGAPASGGPPSRGSSGGALSAGGRERETVSWLNDVILGGAVSLMEAHQQEAAKAAGSKAMPPAE
jgi:hypothetical protein